MMKNKLFIGCIIFSLVGFLPAFGVSAEGSLTRSKASIARELLPQFSASDLNLDKEHEPDSLLIKFAPGVSPDSMGEIIDTLGSTEDTLSTDQSVHIQVDSSRFRAMREMRAMRASARGAQEEALSEEDAVLVDVLNALMLYPEVEYAEPNYIAKGFAVPNDTYYEYQWNFPLIGAEAAWEHTTGEGVVVAVIDTGIAYEDYFGSVQAGDFAQTKFVPGYDFIYRDAHPNDDNGHGTHVAGTIAASTYDGHGAAGIAHHATLMPIKALNRNLSGTYANIIAGIRFAVDNGADIINLSLGGSAHSQALLDAVKYAHDNNVLVIAASGNDGRGTVMYPAAYDDYVLAVGAVDAVKKHAPYSTYGNSLDIVAPGGDTGNDRNGDGYPDGILQETLKQIGRGVIRSQTSFYFYQGTSMAAPHVAGVAALVKSAGVDSADDIRATLILSAEDVHTSGWDRRTGWGMVRADDAVAHALRLVSEEEEPVVEDPEPETVPEEEETPDPTPETPEEPEEPTPDTPDTPEETQEEEDESEEEPVEETPTEESEEPTETPVLSMLLETATYNMWGRTDSRFTFWEKSFLGVSLEDSDQQPLSAVELAVKVYDTDDKLVAEGGGVSDAQGELWIELGKFARGTYTVVTEAVKDGFESVRDTVTFRFR